MVMRIGGLASGMDIDSIVNDLMKVERMPLDRLNQQKQILEWQRDDYRAMNTLLDELDNLIFNGIYRENTFTQKSVSSSNEDAVTARNISSTNNLYTTIRVDQLAEAAYMNSSDAITADTSFDPDGLLVDERSKLTTDFTSNTFTIQAINSDGTLGDEVSFTIDPNTDSLNSVLARINASDAGVIAFYDEHTGKVSLTAKNTGDVNGDAEIKLTGDFLTGSLNLAADNVTAGVNGNEGKNAIFQINGLDTERTSNTFQISGYEYTLKQVTDDGDGVTESGELVIITSQTDTEAIYNRILEFVNKYNETIDAINTKLSEERYRDYPPLTDEQKEALSDREIELWEEKAKSGLIRNDSLLTNGLNQMRLDIYSSVEGLSSDYDHISEIGITTSSNFLERGKLIIDESKLKAAINDDPMAIYRLFNEEVEDGDGNLVHEQSGIALRLRETIDTTITNIEAKAGNVLKVSSQYTIGRNINNLDDQINDLQERLIEIENRYWRQFTAMEKAVQQANSQAMYLMQQFGGGM